MLKNTLIWLFLLGFSQASELELQKEQIATLTNELARLCPTLQKSIKDRTANFIKFTKDDCAISFGYLLDTKAFGTEQINCQSQKIRRNFISAFLSISKHYRFSSFVVGSIASLVVIAFEFAW